MCGAQGPAEGAHETRRRHNHCVCTQRANANEHMSRTSPSATTTARRECARQDGRHERCSDGERPIDMVGGWETLCFSSSRSSSTCQLPHRPGAPTNLQDASLLVDLGLQGCGHVDRVRVGPRRCEGRLGPRQVAELCSADVVHRGGISGWARGEQSNDMVGLDSRAQAAHA